MTAALWKAIPTTCLVGLVLAAGCATNATIQEEADSRLISIDRQAENAYRNGRAAEAVSLYEELVQAIPEDAGYWYRLANAYVRTDREREAVFAYERSLAIDARNPRAWHNMGIVLLRQSQEAFIRGADVSQPGTSEHEQNRRLLDALMEVTGNDAPDESAPEDDSPDNDVAGDEPPLAEKEE